MTSLSRSEAARFLSGQDNFAIVTHRRPDGDTLGSAAALCRGLRSLGKTAYILENPEITEKFLSLHQGLTKPDAAAEDIVISVDVATVGMLSDRFMDLKDRIALRIDHHGTSTSYARYELVDPLAAACGELIYDVLMEMGAAIDVATADALYIAVSTDTGCFRYANTTAHTFAVAQACAQVSSNIFTINQALFETNTLAKLRLQGWMVENTRFLSGGKIAICALPAQVEQALGVTENDMDNISGFPRTIAGVKIAATLREEGDRWIKISVRSLPEYDAGAICAKLGGGGHKGAAGAGLKMSMEEAVEAVIAVMPEL